MKVKSYNYAAKLQIFGYLSSMLLNQLVLASDLWVSNFTTDELSCKVRIYNSLGQLSAENESTIGGRKMARISFATDTSNLSAENKFGYISLICEETDILSYPAPHEITLASPDNFFNSPFILLPFSGSISEIRIKGKAPECKNYFVMDYNASPLHKAHQYKTSPYSRKF